jgi:hypothetical protein
MVSWPCLQTSRPPSAQRSSCRFVNIFFKLVVVLINDLIINDKLQHHSTVCLFHAVPRATAIRADLLSRYDADQFSIAFLYADNPAPSLELRVGMYMALVFDVSTGFGSLCRGE